MKTAIVIAQMLVRLTGVILIILGVSFWAGRALTLLPVHKQVGYMFVLSLWALAALAARAGASAGSVGLALLWGLVVPVLGLTQDRLLVGDTHWMIKVLHLLVGVGAMGMAEGLAAGIRHTRTPAPQQYARSAR